MLSLLRNISEKIRVIKFKKYKKNIFFDKNVTLISNNCLAGIIYQTFELEFKSPTIGLYFETLKDFYAFVTHLNSYLNNGNIIELKKKETNPKFSPDSPIGLLSANNCPSIILHFVHYKNFDEALQKWNRRCKRVNANNVYLVIEARKSECSIEDVLKFLKLNKRMIIYTNYKINDPRCIYTKYFDKYDNKKYDYPIVKLISPFGKRALDIYNIENFFIDNGKYQ